MIQIRGAIFFRKLMGLVALQVAMLLGWRTYDLYQSQILLAVGFATLTTWFLLLQGILAIVIEPVMGAFSDRVLVKSGSRFLSIVLGVTVAGLIFVASSAILRGTPTGLVRTIVPILMAGWIAAMSSFRSPAVSLLYRYAATQTLPVAVALLVMVNGIIGAFGFYINQFLLSLGASLAFGLAGLVLGVGVVILRFVSKEDRPPIEDLTLPTVPIGRLSIIWGLGLGVGFSLNLLLYTAPTLLKAASLDVEGIRAVLLLLSALFCVPAALLAMVWGLKKSFQFSVVALFVVLSLLLFGVALSAWVYLVALGVLLGLALNTMFPLAVNLVPEGRAGLGTGVLFSGFGASFLLYSILGQVHQISSLSGFFVLLGASVLVLFCIVQADLKD
jgi:hypothetical protein